MSLAQDAFYVIGRRTWPDGMQLEASATVAISRDEGGGSEMVFTHECGSETAITVHDDDALFLREIQEIMFCGELAVVSSRRL